MNVFAFHWFSEAQYGLDCRLDFMTGLNAVELWHFHASLAFFGTWRLGIPCWETFFTLRGVCGTWRLGIPCWETFFTLHWRFLCWWRHSDTPAGDESNDVYFTKAIVQILSEQFTYQYLLFNSIVSPYNVIICTKFNSVNVTDGSNVHFNCITFLLIQ